VRGKEKGRRGREEGSKEGRDKGEESGKRCAYRGRGGVGKKRKVILVIHVHGCHKLGISAIIVPPLNHSCQMHIHTYIQSSCSRTSLVQTPWKHFPYLGIPHCTYLHEFLSFLYFSVNGGIGSASAIE